MTIQQNKLGRTEISVSEIAFGGVEIGMPYGIGVRTKEEMLTEQEAIQLLHRAVDSGINFFDTARLYGESERIMGMAFRDRRKEVVLASKCRHLRQENGELYAGGELENFINASLKESLVNLKTDYLDVFMIHYADDGILDNEEVAEIFNRLKKRGLVRAIGVSVYRPEETGKAIRNGTWDMIQLPFNLMDQSHGAFLGEAAEKKIGIVARSVLMRGMLTDRRPQLHAALLNVEQHIDGYRQYLVPETRELPQLATRFVLQQEAIASVLVGIDKAAYLDAALHTLECSGLDKDLMRVLKSRAYPDPGFLNLAEWDKKGWL